MDRRLYLIRPDEYVAASLPTHSGHVNDADLQERWLRTNSATEDDQSTLLTGLCRKSESLESFAELTGLQSLTPAGKACLRSVSACLSAGQSGYRIVRE